MFKRLKSWVLVALTVLLVLIIISINNLSNFQKKLLIESKFEQLISTREALKAHIDTYQRQTENTLLSISTSKTTPAAIDELTSSFNNQTSTFSIQELDETLIEHYEKNYIKHIYTDIPNSAPLKKTADYLPKTTQGKISQHQYMINKKISDQEYNLSHKKYHPHFDNILKIHGFYDLFLIDPNGNVIYSVKKETDFGTNLYSGPYKKSGLARVFKKSLKTQGRKISFSTFSPYEPSFNIPSAFLSTPIYKNDIFLGCLAIQLPIERINKIMTFEGLEKKSGLGESGEAYIVGSDFTMRNDSRFLTQIDDPLIQKLKTTIGIQKVRTPGVISGLNGEEGYKIFNDYRDIPVLSAYTNYKLFSEPSVLLAEIDESEVFREIDSTVTNMKVILFAVFFISIVTILIFFKQLVIRPLKKINNSLENEVFAQKRQVLVSNSLLNEYKKAVDMSAIVSKTDLKGTITYVNKLFCETSGYKQHELIGQNHRIINNPKTPKKIINDLWRTISSKKTWKGVICNRKKDGTDYYVSSTIVPILDIEGEVQEYISIRTDVTEIFQQRQKIMMQTTDSLTGLPNRQKFIELLALTKKPLLALLNIDRFSEINDYYGHQTGDIVLIKFANLLNQEIDKEIIAFRLSSDEFVLLASEKYPEIAFEKKCRSFLEKLEDTIFKIKENELMISATIGIASGNTNAYINAGMALRVAKESQLNFMFYNSQVDLQKRNEENIRWTKKIKKAISNDKISLYIQPIANTNSKRIYKYECLMRLIDENEKEITPFHFIEIAKHARLYSKLSQIIISKSFDYFSNRNEYFSINLTIEDILNKSTTNLLRKKLANKDLAKRAIFEIVESEGIENYEDVANFIKEMKNLNCSVSIDDFGTGYSNFEHLMKLDPNFIKIDGSIIKNISHDNSALRITKLIHEFSKSIGSKTVAEFVCDDVIQEKVAEIGIDYMQGYLIGKPIKAEI